ncbi:R3H domain-containing nucleic acid-binding protein [Verrucomicrobiaceae bacterium 227]
MANAIDDAKEALASMLGKLGFEFEIEVLGEPGHETLNIVSPHSALLIGKNGDRLDDFQYLVNRIVRGKDREAPRYRVDCDGYRTEQEERVADKARKLAEKVKENGRELWMNPMNSYHRRLVHNALVDDPEVESVSEDSGARNKKILIRLK